MKLPLADLLAPPLLRHLKTGRAVAQSVRRQRHLDGLHSAPAGKRPLEDADVRQDRQQQRKSLPHLPSRDFDAVIEEFAAAPRYPAAQLPLARLGMGEGAAEGHPRTILGHHRAGDGQIRVLPADPADKPLRQPRYVLAQGVRAEKHGRLARPRRVDDRDRAERRLAGLTHNPALGLIEQEDRLFGNVFLKGRRCRLPRRRHRHHVRHHAAAEGLAAIHSRRQRRQKKNRAHPEDKPCSAMGTGNHETSSSLTQGRICCLRGNEMLV